MTRNFKIHPSTVLLLYYIYYIKFYYPYNVLSSQLEADYLNYYSKNLFVKEVKQQIIS